MMKKMLEFIGILLIALGVSTADSEVLIIPIVLISIGFILMGFVERSE